MPSLPNTGVHPLERFDLELELLEATDIYDLLEAQIESLEEELAEKPNLYLEEEKARAEAIIAKLEQYI